jgi:hypothetical protein
VKKVVKSGHVTGVELYLFTSVRDDYGGLNVQGYVYYFIHRVLALILTLRMHVSSKADDSVQKFETFAPEALDSFVNQWTLFSDNAIPCTSGHSFGCSVLISCFRQATYSDTEGQRWSSMFP